MRLTRKIVVGSAVLLYLSATARGAVEYRITALDVLPGGMDSRATGINELGVVIGHSTLDRSGHVGRSRPVMWGSAGRPTELWNDPVFGGIPLAVNSSGYVVGRYGSGSGIPFPTPGIPEGGAFLWDPATREFTDLGDLGGPNAMATGINDLGQVSGSSENFQRQARAFIWDAADGMRDIGTLDGGPLSFGTDINNRGEVAGYSWTVDGGERAFIWDGSAGMHDVGSPDGGSTRAWAINNFGEMVGLDWGTNTTLGGMFIASRGENEFYPASPEAGVFPTDINDDGQIVGHASIDGRVRAVLWDRFNGRRDLQDLIAPNSEWFLEEATAINNRGQIVGYGYLDEHVRSFLLEPVPEPNSGTLMALWLVSLLSMRRVCVRLRADEFRRAMDCFNFL